jgi:hypothetical protein
MPDYVHLIRQSGFSIYHPIAADSPLYIPIGELEAILNAGLRGTSVEGLPLRTRSKVVKEAVCRALGYPVPKSFKKEQPRFPGQNLDIYTQTSNNLQVWNEEIDPLRRYAIIREAGGKLVSVRLISGDSLAKLDKTGTLTGKYQARLTSGVELSGLVVKEDTALLQPLLGTKALKRSPVVYPTAEKASTVRLVVHEGVAGSQPVAETKMVKKSPTEHPTVGNILPIKEVYDRLQGLIGCTFPDAGIDQERNRGAALHRLVCEALGYESYADDGQFPDIKAEALEVKLQTSPTIDLGLITPDSTSPVNIPQVGGFQLRHCDCRYAIFDAETDGDTVTIRRVFVTTGEAFFTRFPRFGGNVVNRKIQIPLPRDFFGR